MDNLINVNSAENESKPKVSVILPIYNVEKYLKKCLDSIVNQTFKSIEIICVNDGSTDSSLEILNEYANNDARFIVLSQENQGQGVARNRGIEIAKGEYLQFIDPDDWIEPDAIEILYNFANEHKSEVVKFNYKDYNEYSGEIRKKDFAAKIKKIYSYDLNKIPFFSWHDVKKGFLWSLDLYVWSYFYSTDFVKSNNIKFAPSKIGEDHLFSNGALLLAQKIDFLNKYLYFYRIRKGSSVRIKSDINFCIFDNIKLLKEFLIANDLFNELENEWIEYAKKVISSHYHHVSDKSIEKYEQLIRQYFDNEKEFKAFIKIIKRKRSFLKQIFSIKNEYNDAIKYKIITVLGFDFKIKPKKK